VTKPPTYSPGEVWKWRYSPFSEFLVLKQEPSTTGEPLLVLAMFSHDGSFPMGTILPPYKASNPLWRRKELTEDEKARAVRMLIIYTASNCTSSNFGNIFERLNLT
jgi:hypothetical protein